MRKLLYPTPITNYKHTNACECASRKLDHTAGSDTGMGSLPAAVPAAAS